MDKQLVQDQKIELENVIAKVTVNFNILLVKDGGYIF